ncbi:DNA topoisomerase 3-alpha [Bienertia sinuspersici]
MSASNHTVDSGSSSRSRSEHPPLRCHCNQVAPLRTVRFNGGRNAGRAFYGCSGWPDSCGFLRWVDEVDELRDMEDKLMEAATKNAELRLQIDQLERRVRELLNASKNKQEQIEELAIESDVMRERMYSAYADRKLLVFCVISWVMFFLAFMLKN